MTKSQSVLNINYVGPKDREVEYRKHGAKLLDKLKERPFPLPYGLYREYLPDGTLIEVRNNSQFDPNLTHNLSNSIDTMNIIVPPPVIEEKEEVKKKKIVTKTQYKRTEPLGPMPVMYLYDANDKLAVLQIFPFCKRGADIILPTPGMQEHPSSDWEDQVSEYNVDIFGDSSREDVIHIRELHRLTTHDTHEEPYFTWRDIEEPEDTMEGWSPGPLPLSWDMSGDGYVGVEDFIMMWKGGGIPSGPNLGGTYWYNDSYYVYGDFHHYPSLEKLNTNFNGNLPGNEWTDNAMEGVNIHPPHYPDPYAFCKFTARTGYMYELIEGLWHVHYWWDGLDYCADLFPWPPDGVQSGTANNYQVWATYLTFYDGPELGKEFSGTITFTQYDWLQGLWYYASGNTHTEVGTGYYAWDEDSCYVAGHSDRGYTDKATWAVIYGVTDYNYSISKSWSPATWDRDAYPLTGPTPYLGYPEQIDCVRFYILVDDPNDGRHEFELVYTEADEYIDIYTLEIYDYGGHPVYIYGCRFYAYDGDTGHIIPARVYYFYGMIFNGVHYQSEHFDDIVVEPVYNWETRHNFYGSRGKWNADGLGYIGAAEVKIHSKQTIISQKEEEA